MNIAVQIMLGIILAVFLLFLWTIGAIVREILGMMRAKRRLHHRLERAINGR